VRVQILRGVFHCEKQGGLRAANLAEARDIERVVLM